MIEFTGHRPAWTEANLPILTTATLFWQFETTSDITTSGHIFYFNMTYTPYVVKILNGRLYFSTPYSLFGGSPDEWYCTITANTKYQAALSYNFSLQSSGNLPIVYLNGVLQTMTRSSTFSSSTAHVAAPLAVGGILSYIAGIPSYNFSSVFNGKIGDVSIVNRQCTSGEMIRNTNCRVKRPTLMFGTATRVLELVMDEVSDGVYLQNIYSSVTVDGDVIFPLTPILDNFNRANEGPPPSDRWTSWGNAGLKVLSNVAAPSDVTVGHGCEGIWNSQSIGPDCEVYATFSTIGGTYDEMDLYWRGNATGTSGYFLNWFSNTIQIFTNPDEVTQIGATITQARNNGDSLGVSMIGSTITVFYKPSGGAWTAIATRTDTTHTGGAFPYIGVGIYNGTDGNARVDDFGGGTISGIVSYSNPWSVKTQSTYWESCNQDI